MSQLQYRTYDSLLSSVEEDLWNYSENGLIKRKRYIKTARECNSLLGIKINGSKEDVIEVADYKADLPTDLMSVICVVAFLNGKSNIYFPNLTKKVIDTDCQLVNSFETFQEIKNECIVLSPTRRSLKYFCDKSINRVRVKGGYQIDINENSMSVDFKEGFIYIHYIPHMETEDGELLVLDHPLVNKFYEESVKEKIFRDLWHNNDADTQLKYQECRDVIVPRERSRATLIVKVPAYRVQREWNKKNELQFYNTYIKYL